MQNSYYGNSEFAVKSDYCRSSLFTLMTGSIYLCACSKVSFWNSRVFEELSITKNYCLLSIIVSSCSQFYIYWLRLVCEDISGGQEDVPIPATNLVDNPPVAPTGKLNFQICWLSDGHLIFHAQCNHNILEVYFWL